MFFIIVYMLYTYESEWCAHFFNCYLMLVACAMPFECKTIQLIEEKLKKEFTISQKNAHKPLLLLNYLRLEIFKDIISIFSVISPLYTKTKFIKKFSNYFLNFFHFIISKSQDYSYLKNLDSFLFVFFCYKYHRIVK